MGDVAGWPMACRQSQSGDRRPATRALLQDCAQGHEWRSRRLFRTIHDRVDLIDLHCLAVGQSAVWTQRRHSTKKFEHLVDFVFVRFHPTTTCARTRFGRHSLASQFQMCFLDLERNGSMKACVQQVI